MPHSPRWYRDWLWLWNSGSGEFGTVDLASGRFEGPHQPWASTPPLRPCPIACSGDAARLPPMKASISAPPPAATISLIPVLDDNYVFVIHDGKEAAVVDPGVAPPVIAWLQGHGLELVAVLQTHHHSDHIGGTADLLRRWPAARVIAARADRQRIPLQSEGVGDGDSFSLLGRRVEVLEVPGHTRAHIAFYIPPPSGVSVSNDGVGELFCGDTLFAGGCGRLFEGTPEQMHRSLQRLAALPENTRVWCAHEYTEANLHWASIERPRHQAIAQRWAQVRRERAAGRATIPSSIALERATNLFLQATDADELGRLRQSRNRWNG